MLISIDVSTFNTQQVVAKAIDQKIHRLIMPQILKNIQREPKKKKNQSTGNENKNHLDCGIWKALDVFFKT